MVADIVQRDMDAAGQKARRKAEDEHKASAGNKLTAKAGYWGSI